MKALIAANVAVRMWTAFHMIIPDCDETYNYWEPLNVLFRGFGKQTWEYSPEYAIRSWAYLLVYYTVGYPLSWFNEAVMFYGLRVLMVAFTAYGEYRMFVALRRQFNPSVAQWFLFLSTVAPGMAHAGVALLPSSFAMQTQLLGVAAALDGNYATSAVWQLVGGFLGWPFALALGVPLGFWTLHKRHWYIIAEVVVATGLIAATMIAVDSAIYQRFLLVPWNIVRYNVLSSADGVGPDIFGVEPFSYYVINLLLNFNVVAVAGYAGSVLNYVMLHNRRAVWLVSAPLLIWSVIFFAQPHKEERFLYPVYPLVVVNAALLATKVLSYVPYRALKVLGAVGIAVIGVLRTLALVMNYSAPLDVMAIFRAPEVEDVFPEPKGLQNVCIGKEWYHFPTSMLLPQRFRLQYVESGFDGLLPGDFPEGGSFVSRASTMPERMNNRNQWDPSKIVPVSQCAYYIESGPRLDPAEWAPIACEEMLDPAAPQGPGRLLWIPKWSDQRVSKMEYCVYKRATPV
ncbi:alpha-1,2-mannosyltransferase Alg9p [Diutina catenulata]